MIKDPKIFLVSTMVILMVIISAFCYSLIVREETRTGGMGEDWHMQVGETFKTNLDLVQPDGSVLFTDSESHQISLVDRNGVLEWTHKFGADLIYSQVAVGNIYFIDVSDDGQYALNCVGMDGIWKYTTPCQPIFYFEVGDDGRVYASDHGAENYTTINCFEEGSIIWSFVQKGNLYVANIWADGKVMLRHTSNSYTIVYDTDEMIMLSPTGSIEWNASFPLERGVYFNMALTNFASNGTIELIYQANGTRQTTGYTLSGDLMWTDIISVDSTSLADTRLSINSYYGSQYWEHHTNVQSVYKVDPLNDSNSWVVLLNDTMWGSMYELEGMEIFLSEDGQAYGLDPNGTILWHIQTGVERSQLCEIEEKSGLLVRTGHAILRIGSDGSFWVYDGFDSSIIDARFGSNDTIYVLTGDKLSVIYKPTVSTPTEYLIAMLSVDMLIALSSGLWIADRMIKKPN